MATLQEFISGPLLTAVFVFFILGMGYRLIVLFFSGLTATLEVRYLDRTAAVNLGLRLAPFHRLFLGRPLKTIVLYFFHLCLIIVPIWYSGHIELWEQSALGWRWATLPDVWADWLTIVFLAMAAFLLLRKTFVGRIREESSPQDYIWLVITALPFLSGYFLAHGTLDTVMGESLWTIHVLSGELLIISVVFLFVRIRLADQQCNGCSSCAVECPAASLTYQTIDDQRTFFYQLFLCIKCGNCIRVCPEGAAQAWHEINLKNLFRAGVKDRVITVALARCEDCGGLISPDQQISKVTRSCPGVPVNLCNECKQLSLVGSIHETGEAIHTFHRPDLPGAANT